MASTLAILCLFGAALLSRPQWSPLIGGTRSRVVLQRLSRFVPAWAVGTEIDRSEAKYLASLHRVMVVVDPTSPGFERALRSIGISSRAALIGAEFTKLGGAIACDTLAAMTGPWPASFPAAKFLGPAAIGLSFVFLVNGLVSRAAAARRRRVRSELALAIEMLSIFLEGGQTLDQAFRGFSEMCGQALPHIAAVQRALVTDLNNGISYEKAIARWATVLDVEEAKPLAALFTESLLHGTELVSHLRQISSDLVEARILAARASIGVKSAQLSAVMVAFFLPAILAFVAAPAVVALTSALGSMR